ncbi:MAG: hypothetical protein N4A62_12305 [Marinisporobacter sp.]|nr:hypothetical protein [Marinisporobacter sp.]
MQLTKKHKIEFSTNAMLGILFLLIMGNYILTNLRMYTFEIFKEANYLMPWLMKLPF